MHYCSQIGPLKMELSVPPRCQLQTQFSQKYHYFLLKIHDSTPFKDAVIHFRNAVLLP